MDDDNDEDGDDDDDDDKPVDDDGDGQCEDKDRKQGSKAPNELQLLGLRFTTRVYAPVATYGCWTLANQGPDACGA